jgi:hypothetical protein
MTWNNGPLVLYHGCDDVSAQSIMTPVSPNRHGIHLAYSRPLADFGRGFYTTTYLHQAKNWANVRCQRLRSATPSRSVLATVIKFEVDRSQLAQLQTLTFVVDNPDYWDFVQHCRQGKGLHRSTGNYDVVYGPVSLWPQTLVIKDCDQISFHTDLSLAVLLTPTIAAQATSSADPFLR